MSHNVYYEDNPDTLIHLPNYLIVHNSRITPSTSIQKVMEMVELLKCPCSIYQLAGTKGYDYNYLIDMTKEELN